MGGLFVLDAAQENSHEFRSRQRMGGKKFKKDEHTRDGRKAMTDYENEAIATREKIERLKALRLAKRPS